MNRMNTWLKRQNKSDNVIVVGLRTRIDCGSGGLADEVSPKCGANPLERADGRPITRLNNASNA